MEEISEDEQVRIAQQFLLSSPPGEFNEIVTDLRGMINNDELINKTALSSFKAYNTEQAIAVPLEGCEYKVIIAEEGEIDATHYKDPRGKQIFTFDHVRREASNPEPDPDEIDEAAEEVRNSIDESMCKYVDDHFASAGLAVYVVGDNSYNLVISSHALDSKNFWNGRWKSVWKIEIADGKAQLTGKIKVDAHFFEDGNVALTVRSDKAADVDIQDPAAPGENIVKKIASIEQTFHEGLFQIFTNISWQTLKALKRELPMTKSKLDFSKIAAHKLAGELSTKTARVE